MSYAIPVNNTWKVLHDGATSIARTKNLDFDESGKLKLAQNALVLTSAVDTTAVGLGQVIVNDYVFTRSKTGGSGGRVWLIDPSLGTSTVQTTTDQPYIGPGSDACAYIGTIAASSDTASGTDTIASFAAATWTVNRITGLTINVPHPLCPFENRNTLCVGNGSTVIQTSSASWSQDSSNSLTLPSQYTVTWLRWRQNNLYIGTRNILGGQAKMFIWNGSGTSAQQGFGTNCDWVFSGADYSDSITILSSAGQLLRFNGGGFTELAHFPVYESPYSWSKSNASASNTTGRCANRGMLAEGDVLYINIDGAVQGNPDITYLHSQPSGLWVYDPDVGLYHRAGFNYTKYNTLTITALSSNTLTVGTHLCETGDRVRAVSVSNITGLTASRDYYVVKVDSTKFKLSYSPADAYAGRVITLSGTPSGDTLAANRMTHGATSGVVPGAIGPISAMATVTPFFASTLYFTGSIQDNSNTTRQSIMSFGAGRNVGHFITSAFPTENVTDTFQKLYLELRSLVLDTDSIVIKYRKTNKYGLPTPSRFSDTGLATWVDASTFTILTTTKDIKSASVGDEVEITEGAGAGYTAHISSIDTSTSTYSIVIDEVIPNIAGGDTSDVMIDNWTKIATINNTNSALPDGFAEVPVGQKGSWIQFKVELRGRLFPIHKFSVITKTDK